ncbi:hypothetical protein [Umezakia ovalisporum]|jgi:hypothetical protein|uniref:Uncharacterized protein n=2 Tax=Umezakia ovalisporum TaxID=75695 RepID=A0AA43H0C0_9CYAN|nr:hypothetical protein [Umezakia ovalisporum]MBI1241155.1 hypothetical protein [Nostoc sp. RI_552]MDH6057777.1 hypothetical protein [Umezakia ovalisporum FSS-43]MDH6064809.1 hypothetical protein [Umezakia ovalisporum FSS-62]MDH6067409.1 hypothetical protein [Umezakia ovalisporum APH033B]MDH6070364.1 hypothetical protein [Umezakia ovalisporum CobakiLakeA]
MKSKLYRNAAITVCALGLLGLMIGCWEISVSFESVDSDTSLPVSSDTLNPDATSAPPLPDQTLPSTDLIPANNQTNKIGINDTHILTQGQHSNADAQSQRTLRISNQTDQPVRLALLARQPRVKNPGTQTNYHLPAHWDFDPQEGSEKGLILSLPDGNLKLENGDIIVAFAQDGSRRYWGPYVVGETSLPQWNSENQEWLLVLSP